MHPPVYLDYHATTPVDPRVLEAMLPFFGPKFGNAASRSHRFGWEAEKAVELARRRVAELAGATPREIVFTSGATESEQPGDQGRRAPSGDHIVTMATEHKAVLDPPPPGTRRGAADRSPSAARWPDRSRASCAPPSVPRPMLVSVM